ncbi:MAG: OmpH family outer membrane protein [Rikenellaceae bacterium]|jgi:outer membrane protein|nr:OmpH family outer membrane protein [Rikenellaceae bacterium]
MKKILFLLSAALLTTAWVACDNQKTASEASETAQTETTVAPSLEGEIVYVRMDSLMSNYDMYKELNAALETKSTQADNNLTSRGRTLERNMADFQDKVQKGLLTTRQAQDQQDQLLQQQQNYVDYRDQLLNELAEEEQVMMNRITNSILEFMVEFNKDSKYKMIISTTPGGPILNADPALDVTAEAILGLNAFYAVNKERL